MVAQSLRTALLVVGISASIVCTIGVYLNGGNDKFVRASLADCRKAVLSTTSRETPFCCEGIQYSFWSLRLCHVTFHWFNSFTTSLTPAWSIPLVPCLTTILHDVLTQSSRTLSRIHLHLKRCLLYTSVSVVRTVISAKHVF